MLKTSMSDNEKSSVVTYPFYFINRQSIHITNCMQIIKKILLREVFPAIAHKKVSSKFYEVISIIHVNMAFETIHCLNFNMQCQKRHVKVNFLICGFVRSLKNKVYIAYILFYYP